METEERGKREDISAAIKFLVRGRREMGEVEALEKAILEWGGGG